MPTALPPPADPFDLIPDPAVIHDRIRAAVRTERVLRRLLSVALAARRERDATGLATPANAEPAGVARA